MQNQIIKATNEILGQLVGLCECVNTSQYTKPLELLSNNTIGKHLRHIIEFYDILIDACEQNKPVSYDSRVHCTETETNVKLASERINKALNWVKDISESKKLKLVVSYDNVNKSSFSISSTLERELVYNIEHAIHHMAIIRIAIEKEFPEIILDKYFGIAYSTIRYRDDLCAR